MNDLDYEAVMKELREADEKELEEFGRMMRPELEQTLATALTGVSHYETYVPKLAEMETNKVLSVYITLVGDMAGKGEELKATREMIVLCKMDFLEMFDDVFKRQMKTMGAVGAELNRRIPIPAE